MMHGMLAGVYAYQAKAAASDAATAAARSGRQANEVQRELGQLNDRLDKLVLINMAMWSLLEEKTGLTEEQLADRVQEIDLRDGVADGKMTRTVRKCGNCGRVMSKRHNKCLFCGGQELTDSSFGGV